MQCSMCLVLPLWLVNIHLPLKSEASRVTRWIFHRLNTIWSFKSRNDEDKRIKSIASEADGRRAGLRPVGDAGVGKHHGDGGGAGLGLGGDRRGARAPRLAGH